MNRNSAYTFDERSGRYRSVATGRYVSGREIRAALDSVIDAAAAEMRTVARQLQAGEIGLQEWQLIMERNVKSLHINSTALARGGYAQLSQSDYGRIGGYLKREYRYLANFAEQIASGKQRLDGRFLQRVNQYVESARGTYEQEKIREATKRGAVELRTVRHAADSCDGCLYQESLGWIAIDDSRFVEVGRRTCRRNCKCSVETRTQAEIAA